MSRQFSNVDSIRRNESGKEISSISQELQVNQEINERIENILNSTTQIIIFSKAPDYEKI